MTEMLWLLIVVGGPLVLATLLAYALLRRRRLTRGERAAQHDAIEHVYHDRAH